MRPIVFSVIVMMAASNAAAQTDKIEPKKEPAKATGVVRIELMAENGPMKVYEYTDAQLCRYLIVSDGKGLAVTPQMSMQGKTSCAMDGSYLDDKAKLRALQDIAMYLGMLTRR